MDIDTELTARADRLLRDLPTLAAAARLIGKVAVQYRPAPPPKAAPLKPPERSPGTETKGKRAESGEVTAPPPGPPPCPSPWHKAAVASKASDVALNGGKWLAKVMIDGACWERLSEPNRDHALAIALRGLRWKERASDGGDMVVIERPPVRCWPDMVEAASEVMAQLGPDGAEGAALIGCLAEPNIVDALGAAIGNFRRRLDAGQDLGSMRDKLRELSDSLWHIVHDIDEQAAASNASADIEAA